MRTWIGDCRKILPTLPDRSVHCVVTSPPYWGLRDYGTATWIGGDPDCAHTSGGGRGGSGAPGKQTPGSTNLTSPARGGNPTCCALCGAQRQDQQIGLESSPEDYVAALVEVFYEVRRVLRDDGTCWLNLGDSYAGTGAGRADGIVDPRHQRNRNGLPRPNGFRPKNLIGIPWRVAFALQADGWNLRQDIIWAKPNPMPESVTDRCTKAHEYIFLLTKSERYFYDAEAVREKGTDPLNPDATTCNGYSEATGRHDGGQHRSNVGFRMSGTRNRRSVWTVPTHAYNGAHFAVFPAALIEPCIMAGTSEKGCCAKCGAPWERMVEKGLTAHDGQTQTAYLKGSASNRLALLRQAARERGEEYVNQARTIGWQPTCTCDAAVIPCTVLDPFGGSGTTGAVAERLGRSACLIELNPHYAALIEQRTAQPGFAFL